MSENLIKKIRTNAGDLQIDYKSLANLPAGFTYQTESITTGSNSPHPDGTVTFVYEVPTTTIELIVWPQGELEPIARKTYSNIPQGITWKQLLLDYGFNDGAFAWIDETDESLYCGSYASIYQTIYLEGDSSYPTGYDFQVESGDIILNNHTYYADGN